MKIQHVFIKDFGKIIECDIDLPKDNLITIGGNNSQGKTTFMRAIFSALGGKIPKEMIRQGAEKAKVKIVTDYLEMTFTRTEKTESLKVVEREQPNFICKSPKTLLKEVFSTISVFPETFILATDKAKKDILLQVINIPFSKDFFEGIISGYTDIPHKETDPITIIETTEKDIYNQRTIISRELKKLTINLDQYKDIKDTQPIDINSLLHKKAQYANIQQDNYKKKIEAESLNEKITHLKDRQNYIQQQILILQEEKQNNFNTIMELEEKIFNIKIKDISRELEVIDYEIASANTTNINAKKTEEKKQIQNRVESVKEEVKKLNDIILKIKDYKADILLKTNFPIPDLSIENSQIIYKGLPINQASGAEQLYLALNIALKKIPKGGLKALFFFDPPQLGTEAWKTLELFANKNNIQVLIAKVTVDSSQTAIFIKEGVVSLIDKNNKQGG